MKKENILGIDVIVSDYEQLMESIKKDIAEKQKKMIIAINPEKILTARNDDQLKEILNNADYQIPDGMGIVIASKLKSGGIKSRITGVDTMEKLCQLANKEGYRIFMYGAKEATIMKAKQVLESRYPNIKIVGYQNGYVENDNDVINKINESKAQILFIALGSPKQEKFILKYKDQLCVSIYQGVGGSFDVISGNIKRAPIWMQNIGLEWFYRLIKDPKRIGRQLKLFGFIGLVLSSKKNRGE